MRPFLDLMAPDETSVRVAMLHGALRALGLEVAPEEVAHQTVGPSTRAAVRALQQRLGVPSDDAAVIDAATLAALRREMKARGLTNASRSFTVAGTVRRPDGSVQRRQRLLAFDLDLRGVRVYRDAKTVAKLDMDNGFEVLGEASSDAAGAYGVTFYDWQYARAERQAADVVVFAVDAKGLITGRSRLVYSEDYSQTGLVSNLDIVLAPTRDDGTEYARTMDALNPFLKESGTSLGEIAGSTEQVEFTARELELELAPVRAAADAQLLADASDDLSHELLYGIGRQGLPLAWTVLYKRTDDELAAAIAQAASARLIGRFGKREVTAFLEALRRVAAGQVLVHEQPNATSLDAVLTPALPKPEQRQSFAQALATFRGTDYREFWHEHLPAQEPFKDQPELISGLLLTQQLTVLTGNHQPLVGELTDRGVTSLDELLDLEVNDWRELVERAGVPGSDSPSVQERRRYAGVLKGLLDAAFPTQRVARMLAADQLAIADDEVKRDVASFLERTADFDLAHSRVRDFGEAIDVVAGDHAPAVTSELMRIQRVFQVSTSPEAMTALMRRGLDSAHSIASIPRRSFAGTYATALGGQTAALAIHQRASHIAARAELAAGHLMDYVSAVAPATVMGAAEQTTATEVVGSVLPNYALLFGSPDMCECEQCSSVYGAAAYLVELLRFLWRGEPNADGRTPLDLFADRRPDLAHLLLTCANTNTVLPYIDVANEVMEYYVAHDTLTSFQGYDTGEATAAELRANPQNSDLEAYRNVCAASFPFTLPYHQPLDVIRTYSDHLAVSRYDVMRGMHPLPDAATARAIAAEGLRLSEEEYAILVGERFDGAATGTPLYAHFGYGAATELANLTAVPELLRRSGVAYSELVELVKTQFVNPYQQTLDFLEQILARAEIPAADLYRRLSDVATGTLDPTADPDITAALDAYNAAQGTAMTAEELGSWVQEHFGQFREVITLYEPESRCALDTTELRTVAGIYEGTSHSRVKHDTWSRMHRFTRLWRRLALTIHEVDLLLQALGRSDLVPATIRDLEHVSALLAATRLPVAQLAACWGSIDAYGDASTYRRLFLNRAVQQIDPAFVADASGDYLQDPSQILADHQSAILAALRISEADLAAIYDVAEVVDGGARRAIDPATDALSLPNLSTVYRYTVLAKALKLRVSDLCTIVTVFQAAPFSTWDVDRAIWADVDPGATRAFYELATAIAEAGFNASTLMYVIRGELAPDSTLGLDPEQAQATVRTVRDAFAAVEQSHPASPPSPITAEEVRSRLALTFQPEVVARLMGILDGTASFEAFADANLALQIPPAHAARFTYVPGSGRLTAVGVMADAERAALKTLAGSDASFDAAVDVLYAAPEEFLVENLGGIFDDLPRATAVLLDHPARPRPATFEQRLAYVYEHLVPVLKAKLRRDALAQHIAALIGASAAATALLIADDANRLVELLSAEGFSASYFSDATWTTLALERTDATVDFSWELEAPDPAVPPDGFSVRWEAYIAAPASGEYTLIVDVAEADESFQLYLDDALILEKAGASATTSLEVLAELNAAQMHRLRLDYAEPAQRASVRLRWKTALTGSEVLPAGAAYPGDEVDAFVALATAYHRGAMLIDGFSLSEGELAHLIAFAADFGHLDFKAPSALHWRRLSDYVRLRDAVPQALARLTDVFALANTPSPVPTVAELTALLRQASAWNDLSLAYLVDVHFVLGVDDFKNEIALNRLRAVIEMVAATGLSAETATAWGAPDTDFDVLDSTAQLIKNAVKARYEELDWLDVAGQLSDTIRAHQQQALVAYLLTRAEIQAWGATDADGLYEYLLIDVQMGACMDTSRVVQASAAVQQFVNRCLLNLESDTTTGAERGVSPGAIDTTRWEWMKSYRVWEANRKVFLYPENWLEPEWRNDRSEFFKELESYLVQNDITDRSVEEALRGYLASLNEVANLDVCGTHRENDDDGTLRYLHVFGKTHSAPYSYFYRTWDAYRKWSPWQRVPVDVRVVEDPSAQQGENSGVQLVPVVWKRRLFVFWPEFTRISEAPSRGGSAIEDVAGDTMSTLQSTEILQIRLAWSEYVEGKWTPKTVTKEFVREWPDDVSPTVEKDYLLTPSIAADTQELTIVVSDSYWNAYRGQFTFADIRSPVRAEHSGDVRFVLASEYSYEFAKRRRQWGALELEGDAYLRTPIDHRLLPVDTFRGLDIVLDDPFFFADASRTYFVRPVDIQILDGLLHPDEYKFPEVWVVPERALLDDGLLERRFAPGAALPAQGAARTAEPAPATATAVDLAYDATATGPAFGEAANVPSAWSGWLSLVHWDRGLEFHVFHHPYGADYVTRLNEGGPSRLLESDTSLASDDGATFEAAYDPNFTHGFVQKPADFATRTYYKENVCFDVFGANSSYNMELFFHVPLYIATRLSRNGRYEEAMQWFHHIFDPTTDEQPGPGQTETSRYWKVLPFKTTPAESLEDWLRTLAPNTVPNAENAVIGEWRDNPFDPHLIAAGRPLAYMKHVVIRYVENLVAWGDSLFRQDTRESVFEALQLYVMAGHILGPRPQLVPRRGEVAAESYASLETSWDDFSNALVELENVFPYSSEVPVSESGSGTSLLGVGSALYFCVPPNDELLATWDTVADRLYKIRHCQNLDGVERSLALFAPPIDPAALIQATSQGVSLGSILADLSSPPPIYRFTHLIQKANELCADVRALGTTLLATLERKDADELDRLRATHESQMLAVVTGIRERQVLDARVGREDLQKARDASELRLQHYLDLLGNDELAVPTAPTVAATLTADSQLPADTTIPAVVPDVDVSLVQSGESGVKLIPKEKQELDKTEAAKWVTAGATAADMLAGILNLLPQFDGEVTPFGLGAGAWWGGQNLGPATSALAKGAAGVATFLTQEAGQAATVASYIRREHEWTFQANAAAREIVQLDKQITSADIKVQIAEQELVNHQQEIDHAEEIELFLRDRFTNQELFQWMREQLLNVHRQSYNLAYDLAKKTEKAFRYETGDDSASFIQYGYWEDSRQGLLAGERLQLALRQLESAYLDDNHRELELSKSISLLRLNPLALIELRETGQCYVSVPEELFDLDFRGHYFRRLRSLRVSIPCVAGPHTSVSCSVRLLSNSVRVTTAMNSAGNYEHENDEGMLIDDVRFTTSVAPVTAIATSSAQADPGMFELSFRDERYLPFEYAGAISEWMIELSTDSDLRQFDYATISDVILHLSYTARESGGSFKEKATEYLKDFLANAAQRSDDPLVQMFSLRSEFPTEWARFLRPTVEGDEQILAFTIGARRLPFIAAGREVTVSRIELFARSVEATTYEAVLTETGRNGDPVESDLFVLPPDASYGGLNKATLQAADAGLDLEQLDLEQEITLKLKQSGAPDFASLAIDPQDEIEDAFIVLHYRLG